MLLMQGLINITLNTLTIGIICYILLSYWWGLKLVISEAGQENIFGHGIFFLILFLLATAITILSSPITYTIYLFSTMINIQAELQVPVDTEEDEDEE